MIYKTLQPKHASSWDGDSIFLPGWIFFCFCAASLGDTVCVTVTVSTDERSRSERGSPQHKEHSLKRLTRMTLLSLHSSVSLSSILLLFGCLHFPSPLPWGETFSYCWFFFVCYLSLFFLCCCSDETLFSDVEVASCVARRLLYNQFSAVQDESLDGAEERKTRAGDSGGFQKQWFRSPEINL